VYVLVGALEANQDRNFAQRFQALELATVLVPRLAAQTARALNLLKRMGFGFRVSGFGFRV
jgi:hypothetical protein